MSCYMQLLTLKLYLYFYGLLEVWRPEDNLWESVLSCHYVGLRDSTQVISLGRKCLYVELTRWPALDLIGVFPCTLCWKTTSAYPWYILGQPIEVWMALYTFFFFCIKWKLSWLRRISGFFTGLLTASFSAALCLGSHSTFHDTERCGCLLCLVPDTFPT